MHKNYNRIHWMDSLRGFAILLVVSLHVTTATSGNFPNHDTQLIMYITGTISPLRMPLLVFMTGLLVPRSISKGFKKYFKGKIFNILYPYVVWMLLISFLIQFGHSVFGLNFNTSINLPKDFFFHPWAHLWYLYNLFIYFIIIFYLNKINIKFPVILSIAIYMLIIIADIENEDLVRFFSLFCFFALGSYLGQNIHNLTKKISVLSYLELAILTIIGILFSIINLELNNGQSYELLYSLSCLFLIPIILRTFLKLDKFIPTDYLEYLGKNSIVIYLAHYPLSIILYHFFNKFPISYLVFQEVSLYQFYFQYFLSFFLIMLFCIIIIYLRRKTILVKALFSYPKSKT